jgi:hypothetical protein
MLHDEGVQHMAPLLKPSECSLLVLNSAGAPTSQAPDPAVAAGRDRILRAAALCGIPTFLAMRELEPVGRSTASKRAHQQIYGPPIPGNPWGETPLGLAVARASRLSLLICGYWLDECITFTALNALGEGYDLYLLTDASPPLDIAQRDTAILRLVQAGVVPTTTKQVIREWTGEIPDMRQRQRLLALV